MIRTGGAKGAFASSVHRPGRGFDAWLLASAGILLLIGLAAIHSVDISRSGGFMVRQMLWAAIGLVLFMGCASVSQRMLERFSPALYWVSLASLVAVLVAGKKMNGATRWIDFGPIQFQPSEFAKVAFIVTLTVYYSRRWDATKELNTYLGSMLHLAPFIVLVLLQPHLAGAATFGMIWLAVSLCAGVPWKFVAATVALVGGLFAIAWSTPVLPDYVRARIMAKFSPPDAKGIDYQQSRAKIAIATGGFLGQGYLQGEQKAAGFIPEQQNDFIFTVVGEEGGLVGGGLVLLAFGFFFFRVWLVGFRAAEPFGQMLSMGVLSVLGFHTIVNLGMNVGILPVAGLWLPFMSYGGTALWMCLACVGLLAGVK